MKNKISQAGKAFKDEEWDDLNQELLRMRGRHLPALDAKLASLINRMMELIRDTKSPDPDTLKELLQESKDARKDSQDPPSHLMETAKAVHDWIRSYQP